MDVERVADWLTRRVLGPRAESEWEKILEAATESVLDAPLSSVLPAEALEGLVLEALEPARLRGDARAIAGALIPFVVARLREDHAPIGRWMTEEGQRTLLDLVSEPGLIDPEWIRMVFQQGAMEVLVADTLMTSLKDFSTIVPRLVQSLAPALLGRLAKLGGLGTGGLGTRFLEELERRLEPEIKKFLKGGTRRALDGASRFATDHVDDPVSLASRRNIARFVLDQPGAFHTRAATDARLEQVEHIAMAIAEAIANRPEAREIASDVIRSFYAQHGSERVRMVLKRWGFVVRPSYASWAKTTWPALRASLESAGVRAWIHRLAEELIQEFGSDSSGPAPDEPGPCREP